MKTIYKLFIVFLLFIVANNAVIAAKASNKNHASPKPTYSLQSINGILDTYAADANVGIIVKSMDNGAVLYSRNAEHFFMPASTMKILTAITALSYLGNDYTFVTKIAANSQNIENGVLNSDIYIHFDGDPSLTKDDVEELIADLVKQGIQKINGNVYIDDYVYDQKKYGRGWMWDELNLCYAAPTTGAIVDKNCFWLQLSPSQEGSTASITKADALIPSYSAVLTKTLQKSSDCPLDIRATDNNEYYLSGCIKPQKVPVDLHIAVNNPRIYAGNLVSSLLQKYAISVTGKIGFAQTGQAGYVLASHSSVPLNELVKKMMKHSDNLIADSLYKKIAANYFGSAGTWINGNKAIKQLLTNNTAIDLTKLKMFDGSGLSRYNLISPNQMMQLLLFAYNNQAINNAFVDSLPISGIDGSLRWRMGKNGMQQRVRAKTGTMTGISSLAGYVDTISHKKIAFVIVFNSFPESPRKYAKVEDKICEVLAGL
jgi:serine-type D-Ala-D-Ala carboxypeptidase/endopeptidase (penicillin-binding protein 4)